MKGFSLLREISGMRENIIGREFFLALSHVLRKVVACFVDKRGNNNKLGKKIRQQ